MGKLLRIVGRPAIGLAALTVGPVPSNFESVSASSSPYKCAAQVGRVVLGEEVCVNDPVPSEFGRSVVEDYRVWLIGGGLTVVIAVGLGAAVLSFSDRKGYLDSDGSPESIAADLARQQKDIIDAQTARNVQLDKIEAWWDARGETSTTRYLFSSLGGVLSGVWEEFKGARREARDDRRQDRAEREESTRISDN